MAVEITGIVKKIIQEKLPKEEQQQMEIFCKISEARKRLGWTEQDLAKKSGVEEKSIHKIETMIAELSLVEFLKICNALGLEVM